MTGVSYAGGIEPVSAAIDAHRRDRPDHRLAQPHDRALQGGDGQGRLVERALRRRSRPRRAGWTRTSARVHPRHHVRHASAEDRAWFASRGPGDLVKQITVPTFLVEGTADTLFTLNGKSPTTRS
jgi:ABC-2 type transport system ATP-binding protein